MLAKLRERKRSLESRIPRSIRWALSVGRIIGGLKGLRWVWGVIVSLVANGTLWATLQSWPLESRIIVALGATLAAFTSLGHIGALVKAKSGQLALMSDRAFWDYINELLLDTAGYLTWETVSNDPALREQVTSTPGAMEHLDRLSPKTAFDLEGEGAAALDEAVRRKIISGDERSRHGPEVSSLDEGLKVVVTRLPRVTGLRGNRPTFTRSAHHIEARHRPPYESEGPER